MEVTNRKSSGFKSNVQFPVVLGLMVLLISGCGERQIDYSAEVKPILNKRCITCHGGVKKNSGFSVLFRHEALDTAESGKLPIVPGHPERSELIRRITSTDPEERMPYKEDPLTSDEIGILTKWIEQGAPWGDHWAYIAPEPVDVPRQKNLLSSPGPPPGEWVKNDIDYFILDKLKEEDLNPSPEADRATLLRRVHLDVTGLPPTPEEAERFLRDNHAEAYEKVVDALLASPHFGEKWASWWLDLARYADTKGYEKDPGRTIWRYRDWVIKAFNQDKPFDIFTLEQLAGDLLKDPTDDQLIATAFHRNTMNNDEGGTDDEEFRVAALIDRVNTTYEVWLSTTFGCIQCHSHPYDPFVHEDYYRSLAFFNNTRDEDTQGEHPTLRTYAAEDQQKLEAIREWVRAHSTEKTEMEVTRFLKTIEPKYHPHDFDQFINGELLDGKLLGIRPEGRARLKQVPLDNKAWLYINYKTGHEGGTLTIRLDQPDGEIIARTNLEKSDKENVIRIPIKKTVTGRHDLYFFFDNPHLHRDQPVCGIEWFAFYDNLPGDNNPDFHKVDDNILHLLNAKVDETPVMIENSNEQRRKTHVFERGNWLVKGEEVKPAVPELLNPFPENAPADRLGFAQWLVSPDNPLTARTVVNRIWEQLFGYGIVETLEDFGTQGAAPSHPELLDWLAWRFMHEHDWSMKKLIKEIVMSATYRQDSRVTPLLLEKDPDNRLLARGPRIRLSAEQIRDQALAVSGLLSDKMYGKSVMPYQPEGVWNSVYSNEYWKQSEGEDQYRRAVYTYMKRTSPYPAMIMFDASSREVCLSRRIRTNTPLQALVTLNDPAFVETAHHLARIMVNEAEMPPEQIRAGYRRILVRDISDEKLNILSDLYSDALVKYAADHESVREITNQDNASPELAALTVVANALLNLDETITKE